MLDHLIFAAPELAAGVALVEEMLGVRPAAGGQHLGRGTHNALLSLRGGAYLEVIAPDPDQPRPQTPLPFGLDRLTSPRLVTWAASAADIERKVEAASAAGYNIGSVLQMSRELPDGGRLHWALTYPPPAIGDGLVPFLIRWEPGPHPSRTSPGGCELISLRGEHPQPEPVLALLSTLGLELPVAKGPAPALIAAIRSPRGVVELR